MKKIAYILLSSAFVFALFSRCVGFSYIGLDDAAYTFRNPFVAGGLSVSNVVEAFTNFRHGGIWMPVTYISYMIDASICRWTGLPLVGEMHFVNVLLHAVNFFLLWKLLTLIFGRAAFPHAAEGSENRVERAERVDCGNREEGIGKRECSQSAIDTIVHKPQISSVASRLCVSAENEHSQIPTLNSARSTCSTRLNPKLSTLNSTRSACSTRLNPKPLTLNSKLLTVIAAMAAMTWAVHPLRAEPVAWIAARKELLWTLFTLAGLIVWIKALTVPHPPSFISHPSSHSPLCVLCGSAGDKNKLLTILFCVLACLSKPTAMCFPILALLVVWFCLPRRRRDAEATGRGGVLSLSALAPLFIIAVVTAAIAAYSQTHVAGQEAVALYAAPISHRLVNALSAVGNYLRVTFWPFGLHVDCRAVPGLWPLDAGWNFAALAIAVLAMVLWKWLTHNSQLTTHNSTRSTRLIIFSALWFLISLLPTLGLFGSFGVEAHADRFAYLPSMAFAFLIAGFAFARSTGRAACPHAAETGGPQSTAAVSNGSDSRAERVDSGMNSTRSTCSTRLNSKLLTLIVIVLLSLVTFQQLSYWRDDGAAHQRVLDCDPGHPRAMVHVADVRCSRRRDFDGGIRLYRQALSLSGAVPKGGLNVADVKARLAYALASRGGYDDFAEVKSLGAEVLQDFRRDRRGMMLDALGTAYRAEGDSKRAALLFKASIEAPDRFWPKASTRRKLESCK